MKPLIILAFLSPLALGQMITNVAVTRSLNGSTVTNPSENLIDASGYTYLDGHWPEYILVVNLDNLSLDTSGQTATGTIELTAINSPEDVIGSNCSTPVVPSPIGRTLDVSTDVTLSFSGDMLTVTPIDPVITSHPYTVTCVDIFEPPPNDFLQNGTWVNTLDSMTITAVPEPSSFIMLGFLGVFSLVVRKAKKNKV